MSDNQERETSTPEGPGQTQGVHYDVHIKDTVGATAELSGQVQAVITPGAEQPTGVEKPTITESDYLRRLSAVQNECWNRGNEVNLIQIDAEIRRLL